MTLSKELLDILACPLCKSPVRLEGEKLLCRNADCGCRYTIQDGIPNMLIDDAERPCPRCGIQRDWDSAKDTITCPKCRAAYTYRRAR